MSDWESMQKVWRSVEPDPASEPLKLDTKSLSDRLRKRSRWVQWYMVTETIAAPVALVVMGWAWSLVDSPFERLAVVTLLLCVSGYWLAVLGAYRRQKAPVPVRPWAIRAQMLRVSRFWLVVCRAATLMFFVILPVPILDALIRGFGERWPYLTFTLVWSFAWIVACQVLARRLWTRSRAYCIGAARKAPYRIF